MTVSYVHCHMIDLPEAVRWFVERCGARPTFSDDRMAVLVFDQFTLILDVAATDSVATIGFNSADCDADVAAMVARGAIVLEPPQDRQSSPWRTAGLPSVSPEDPQTTSRPSRSRRPRIQITPRAS